MFRASSSIIFLGILLYRICPKFLTFLVVLWENRGNDELGSIKMGKLLDRFVQVYNTTRAVGAGFDEGAIRFIAAIPDGAAYLTGLALSAAGVDIDRKKGWASGDYLRDKWVAHAHKEKGYDPRTETPNMTSVREGTANVTEIGALFVPGLGAAGSVSRAKTIGTITTATYAAPIVQGIEKGLNAEP
jgi:hypothetical protein